jgi:aspartyl/asparaginyl beta-hydroxylase (cupin superfamily)
MSKILLISLSIIIIFCLSIIIFRPRWYIQLKAKYYHKPIFYNLSDFPEMKEFHDNFKLIQSECIKVSKNIEKNFNDIPRKQTIWSNSEKDDDARKFLDKNKDLTGWIPAWSPGLTETNYEWLNFPLMALDRKFENNLKLCPVLGDILKRNQKIINIAGFSLLKPGATLAEHVDTTGIDYGSMAYHLGLIVPFEKSCDLIVDGQKKLQHEGQSIIFESSYIHSAKNWGTLNRIILYIDFKI